MVCCIWRRVAVGNAQFTGDAHTGVQAASLSKTNIRTKNARVKLAAINTTAAGTIGSSAWAIDMVTQNGLCATFGVAECASDDAQAAI